MRTVRALVAGVVLALAATSPSWALCAIGGATNGLLGRSADGRQLGSENLGGASGSLSLAVAAGNTITVSAPVWAQTPNAYDSTGEVREFKLSGLLTNSGYQSQALSRSGLTVLTLTPLKIDARATTARGFAPGNYQLKVVVTCS